MYRFNTSISICMMLDSRPTCLYNEVMTIPHVDLEKKKIGIGRDKLKERMDRWLVELELGLSRGKRNTR